MNTAGDAAEQIVKMSLNGVEVAAKITGAGAKELAMMIYAILKDQKKTKGKTRLTNMLRSEKPLKVFAVKDSELQLFCKEAKKYGVLYCVLKDKDANDGLTDIMVRAEDASKINRIFERFKLATVDVGEVRSEIERQRQEQAQQKKDGEIPTPERTQTEERTDAFLDQLMAKPPNAPEQQNENPTDGRVAKSRQSEPTSATREGPTRGTLDPRPSVREELKQIRAEQSQMAGNPPKDKNKTRAANQHQHPSKGKKKQHKHKTKKQKER
jgi:hypothetical protein